MPAAFLCNLEFINNGEILRAYKEGMKEKANEYFSDLVFFYLYLCFFQTSHETQNFQPQGTCFDYGVISENILASLLFNLKLSLQFYKRFFLSRFKKSQNMNQQAKLPYYSGKFNKIGKTLKFLFKPNSISSN